MVIVRMRVTCRCQLFEKGASSATIAIAKLVAVSYVSISEAQSVERRADTAKVVSSSLTWTIFFLL